MLDVWAVTYLPCFPPPFLFLTVAVSLRVSKKKNIGEFSDSSLVNRRRDEEGEILILLKELLNLIVFDSLRKIALSAYEQHQSFLFLFHYCVHFAQQKQYFRTAFLLAEVECRKD